MKSPFSSPLSPPFIFTDTGDGQIHLRSTRESVMRLAAVVKLFHTSRCSDNSQPIQFSAKHAMAPELIAACWTSGVPFWSSPDDMETSAHKKAQELIHPVEYKWQEALQLYLDVHGAELPPHKDEARPEINTDSIFCYIFTSGSSGEPKLIALRRSQMLAAASNAAVNGTPEKNQSWLLCLPLTHIGGASVVLRSWIYGNSVVDARNSAPDSIHQQLLTNISLSFASMVPTQLARLLDSGDDKPVHDSFRVMLLGGGPSAPELIRRAREASVPVMKSYGMTETCAQVAAVPFKSLSSAPVESSGKIFPDHQVSIRTEDGKDLNSGETGIIWLRGPQIIQHYVHAAQQDDAFDNDGWFCTGDFGRVDENGWLYIEMRRSDLIVTGGENIDPKEIEGVLRASFPWIEDLAVAGLPDPRWGQKMVVWIKTPENQSPDEQLMREQLKKQLPAYKVPKEIRFVTEIPRNGLGKLLRAELEKL